MRFAAAPATLAALGIVLLMLVSCRPSAVPESTEALPSRDRAATPLPTRETTIDPVTRKLDAAQLEAERRRSEIDQAGK
ncbi:MAG TPA: hypothetical protein PLW72_10380 [Burkholderiaceae bacterium]|nr:hypothetical protein [Burkholderiaceae bacterium]